MAHLAPGRGTAIVFDHVMVRLSHLIVMLGVVPFTWAVQDGLRERAPRGTGVEWVAPARGAPTSFSMEAASHATATLASPRHSVLGGHVALWQGRHGVIVRVHTSYQGSATQLVVSRHAAGSCATVEAAETAERVNIGVTELDERGLGTVTVLVRGASLQPNAERSLLGDLIVVHDRRTAWACGRVQARR